MLRFKPLHNYFDSTTKQLVTLAKQLITLASLQKGQNRRYALPSAIVPDARQPTLPALKF